MPLGLAVPKLLFHQIFCEVQCIKPTPICGGKRSLGHHAMMLLNNLSFLGKGMERITLLVCHPIIS